MKQRDAELLRRVGLEDLPAFVGSLADMPARKAALSAMLVMGIYFIVRALFDRWAHDPAWVWYAASVSILLAFGSLIWAQGSQNISPQSE